MYCEKIIREGARFTAHESPDRRVEQCCLIGSSIDNLPGPFLTNNRGSRSVIISGAIDGICKTTKNQREGLSIACSDVIYELTVAKCIAVFRAEHLTVT